MYIQEHKILGVFVSDVRASGFWASGGLEPSKNGFGRAGGRSQARARHITSCQTHWKANNWTIQNLLDRYHSGIKMNKSSTTWKTSIQKVKDGEIKIRYLTSNEVKNAINSGYYVKIIQKLIKSSKGWVDEEYEIKYWKLDLFDEYSFPMPMPDDEFLSYHVDSNQAYLMLATSGTGIYISNWIFTDIIFI